MPNKFHFENVTLLITHFNRSNSLEWLLKSFIDQEVSFEDIVVSDDCSNSEHLDKLRSLQSELVPFRLITSRSNKGLGNNINKGQDAVNTEYTLYIQEDFEANPGFAEYFSNAMQIMTTEHQWDIIRFYSFPIARYPYLKPYKNGFSEMIFSLMPWYTNHLKFYYYSDHPHLRRKSFFEKFGRYIERAKGDITEYTMCLSFLKHKGRGLIYTSQDLFIHENPDHEPSTMVRSPWKLKKSFVVQASRAVYLKYKVLKNTIELMRMPQ